MDRNALTARCATRFRDEDHAVYTESDWVDYVNDAYAEVIAARHDWPFLESRNESLSVTAGTGFVALPTDGWRVTAVYNATNDFPLEQLDGRADYRHWFPNPDQNLGVPELYRLRSNNLEVYPWPAATTTLHVDLYLPPALLVNSTDEPIFPEQYHRILVARALSEAHRDDGNLDMAGQYEQQYGILLGNMGDDLLSTRGERYPEVRDTF